MGKKVGALIKSARTGAGLTQEQLARKVKGVSASDISAAERGILDLSQQNLKDIAKATGVTQASLLNAASTSSTAKKTTTSKKTTTTAKKKTSTTTAKKKTSTSSSSSTASKSSMQVTATEKKIINLYREADAKTKKQVMSVLKGTQGEDMISDIVQSAIQGVFKK